MELKEKYFHTILPYQDTTNYYKTEEVLYKLESIFSCGYILPYKDMLEMMIDVSRHPYADLNDDERISISLNRANEEEYDRTYREENHWRKIENAYEMFALNGASIVLNEELKKRYFLSKKGIYLERQVSEPISLDLMDAISIVPTRITAEYFDPNDYDLRLRALGYIDLRLIRGINTLKKDYGYDVPIVSVLTGTEFNARVRKRKD